MSHARLGGGFTHSHQGVTAQLPSITTNGIFGKMNEVLFTLNCANDRGTIVLELVRRGNGLFKRVGYERLVADPKAKADENRRKGIENFKIAPLTVAQDRL